MDYFPLFIDLKGERVIVVGGGKVAERKIRLLLRAGARVSVVAETLTPAIESWQTTEQAHRIGAEFTVGQLTGARLVFAATDDAALNRRVRDAAEQCGIPVNVVDDRRLSRFITPAMVERDPIQIAISSGGASPVLARRLRGWLESLLPAGLGKVAAAAGSLRAFASALPLDQRRRRWDRILAWANVVAWSRRPVEKIRRDMEQALRRSEPARATGRVFLVGAGPGLPDLLTVRAMQLLGQADVVLHDRLVGPEIIERIRRDAEIIDVGKRAGSRHQSQDQINRLLVEHAQGGRQVVRLKGGDGFIFGRGGEELEYLRRHGIAYEVVPGITAAIGCAAFAGIPLTHRDHAHSLTFVSGHAAAGGKTPAWSELAGTGRTLVVYMGLGQAGSIREQLLGAGIDPLLPAALIANGTNPDQQVVHGKVDTLPAMAAQVRRGTPTLMILGEVAALGKSLAWFDSLAGVQAAA